MRGSRWALIVLLAAIGACSEPAEYRAQPVVEPSAASLSNANYVSTTWSTRTKAADELSSADLRIGLTGLGYSSGDVAAIISSAPSQGDILWKTSNHIFGFIPTGASGAVPVKVQDARGVQADTSLRGQQIKLTMDGLRVMKYPGKGQHNIAFNFHAQTQSGDELIPLDYAVGYSAREGDVVPSVGITIFVGLNVGTQGVDLKASTINVNTARDRNFFTILASNAFTQGLQLLPTAQPALRPLSQLTDAVRSELSDLNKGVPVQKFELGLDFSDVSTRIKLREGSYVVVQVPPADARQWNWSDWEFANGLVRRTTDAESVPYNYVIFSISRLVGT